MDDSTYHSPTPNPTSTPTEPALDTMPEATSTSPISSSQDTSSSSDRQSLSSIHDTLATFEQEMKAVLTPENFERRFREKRRTMYSKYIDQELGNSSNSDALRQTLLSHTDLLDEASKNDVFRAILLEDTMEKVGGLEPNPIKAAEKKLALVRDIYDAAEKVDPDKGGVTPEWAVRKRREIRGGLAREIVASEENLKDVEGYISSFEQYEVNRISNDDEWKDGDAELARHFRQVMREKERGELHQVEEAKEGVSSVSEGEERITSVQTTEPTYTRPEEVTIAQVEPVAPVATIPEPAVTPEPILASPAVPEQPATPIVERKRPEEIVASSMSGATRRVRNINPGPVGAFFTGVLEGKVSKVGVSEGAPLHSDTSSVQTEKVAEPVKEPASDEDTIEQTLRAAIDQIRRDQDEGTAAPVVTDHSGQPIQAASTEGSQRVEESQGTEVPISPPPVEKKKGFFGKLFGR